MWLDIQAEDDVQAGNVIPLLHLHELFPSYAFRSSSKAEEACDMYTRAANMFKMAKNWNGKHIHIIIVCNLFVTLQATLHSAKDLTC